MKRQQYIAFLIAIIVVFTSCKESKINSIETNENTLSFIKTEGTKLVDDKGNDFFAEFK